MSEFTGLEEFLQPAMVEEYEPFEDGKDLCRFAQICPECEGPLAAYTLVTALPEEIAKQIGANHSSISCASFRVCLECEEYYEQAH